MLNISYHDHPILYNSFYGVSRAVARSGITCLKAGLQRAASPLPGFRERCLGGQCEGAPKNLFFFFLLAAAGGEGEKRKTRGHPWTPVRSGCP